MGDAVLDGFWGVLDEAVSLEFPADEAAAVAADAADAAAVPDFFLFFVKPEDRLAGLYPEGLLPLAFPWAMSSSTLSLSFLASAMTRWNGVASSPSSTCSSSSDSDSPSKR